MAHTQSGQAAVRIFAVNERMNQMLIEHLDPAAWRAQPPGKVRTIAAIFTHMHNVRTKWVRLTAPHLKVPRQLNRTHCDDASRCVRDWRRAPPAARRCLRKRLAVAAASKMFRRDGWARPWPVGVEMLCYMLAHEAHHRGQVCMLAHQLGFPLPMEVTSGMWKLGEAVGRRSGLAMRYGPDSLRSTRSGPPHLAAISPAAPVTKPSENGGILAANGSASSLFPA